MITNEDIATTLSDFQIIPYEITLAILSGEPVEKIADKIVALDDDLDPTEAKETAQKAILVFQGCEKVFEYLEKKKEDREGIQ